MDSILGKILSSILGLLAIAGVVMLGVYGLAHHKTDSAVADVASLAVNVRATYVNNPAGYASLTNAVAVGAGDVPASMLKDGQIVNAWGSSVTLGPVAGQPKDFSINLGAVPQPACVQLLTADPSLMGAQVGGKQVALPVDPAAAATACAGAATATGVPMTVQYGQSKVPLTPTKVTLTYWIVGGGGAGAGGLAGGGGGSVLSGSTQVTPGLAFSVVVGQGGAPAGVNQSGANGQPSSLTAPGLTPLVAGGGRGGASVYDGLAGGASGTPHAQAGGTGLTAGGTSYYMGGGGAGAAGPGTNATLYVSGSGGPGLSSSLSGRAITYACGGGGGGDAYSGLAHTSTAGAAGCATAGAGSATSAGGAAQANSGSGGGGGGNPPNGSGAPGGPGGSGVVIVALPATDTTATAQGAFSEIDTSSQRVFVFTGNGSLVP